MVRLEFLDTAPPELFDMETLRAGNNDSERMAPGRVSTDFPKLLPVEGSGAGRRTGCRPQSCAWAASMRSSGPSHESAGR